MITFLNHEFSIKKVLDETARTHLIENIADHLKQCTDKEIVLRSIAVFANVDEDFGKRLAQKVGVDSTKK